jgi:SAM-dependent methyltransferase
MNKNVKDFWEDAHQKGAQEWLSGTHLNELRINLNLDGLLKPNLNVLNIGVGMGVCTKELVDFGCVVDVLDISDKAIEKVKDITNKQYLASFEHALPRNRYDLVISYLVAQHMNDVNLNRQMKYVIRSLKPSGVFALQFAFIEDYELMRNDQERIQGEVAETTGGVIRPLEDIQRFVEDNGGFLEWVSDVCHSEHTIAKWQFVHIKRKV